MCVSQQIIRGLSLSNEQNWSNVSVQQMWVQKQKAFYQPPYKSEEEEAHVGVFCMKRVRHIRRRHLVIDYVSG